MPKVSTGSICCDQAEERSQEFVVLGYCRNSLVRSELHPSSYGTDITTVKGLDLNSSNSKLLQKNLINLVAKTVSNEQDMAQNSLIFHDADLVRNLLTALSPQ